MQTLHRRPQPAGRTGIALLAVVLALISACASGSDIRGRLEKDFTRTVGTRSSSSAAFWSARTVPDATDYINRLVVGNEVITDTATGGRFVQYRDAVVGVFDCSKAADAATPTLRFDVESGCGGRPNGSVVYVDDYVRGRTRWLPYVGSRWGLSSGLGSSFRGGGSGDGK